MQFRKIYYTGFYNERNSQGNYLIVCQAYSAYTHKQQSRILMCVDGCAENPKNLYAFLKSFCPENRPFSVPRNFLVLYVICERFRSTFSVAWKKNIFIWNVGFVAPCTKKIVEWHHAHTHTQTHCVRLHTYVSTLLYFFLGLFVYRPISRKHNKDATTNKFKGMIPDFFSPIFHNMHE